MTKIQGARHQVTVHFVHADRRAELVLLKGYWLISSFASRHRRCPADRI
ncbi:MAG: hypothetical protein U5O16_23840 [Rhodococcus sp. (in: high G+C Gram-positive bacteria)]|nr:hypothetical protein [Rhodococcus sp. (in: high G+C Gram-positive bacteria)]